MYQYFSYQNKKVAFQLFSKNNNHSNIVFVHGFPEDGTIFKHQYEFLKEKHTVLVLDLPGSGQSEYNEALQSVGDFAEVIRETLAITKTENCILLGHSMGGYITLAFAEKYAEYLSGLGLIHSTAYADREEKKENRRRSIKIMAQYGGTQFLKSMIPSLFSNNFKLKHPDFIDHLIEKGNHFKTETLQQYYQIMLRREDHSEVLSNMTVPVLFIIGEQDKAVSPQDVLLQVSLPKTASVTLLTNSAHMGFIEEEDKVNTSLEAFIQLCAEFTTEAM